MYSSSKQIYKEIFWLLILSASATCAGIVMRQVLSLYSGEAVTYLVDTNYLKFDTTFPAVTVCEQANAERVAAYTKRNKLPRTLNLFLKDMTYWSARVCSCTACRPGYCTDDFYEMVKAIRAGCKELLTDCWWADEHFSCCDRFLPIETEFGTCYVFNSRLTGNETALIVNRKIGLPNLVLTAIQDVAIRVHSPDDMCTVGMENALGKTLDLPLITDFEIILTAEETLSEEFVTSMPPRVRGCLLKDERPSFAQEWPSSRYSFSTCMLHCRALTEASLCNCTHHLMPKLNKACLIMYLFADDIPRCDIKGLACLSMKKSKETLVATSCNCPMSCEEVTYKPVHVFTKRHVDNVSPELAARGTRGLVRLANLPTTRVQRAAIRHTLGLVVDIGGVVGVFLGATLLNVIEIVYLLCIRRTK